MKLVINYDLVKRLKDVNEPFGPFKIMRNMPYLTGYYCTAAGFAVLTNMPDLLGIDVICFASTISTYLLTNKMFGIDFYADRASDELKSLVPRLRDLNLDVDYDLLLDSVPYEKKYKIELNKEQLPQLLESKYILVPTYSYNGEIKDTSILQEHVVGSRQYVLSIGSPQKSFRAVRVNA